MPSGALLDDAHMFLSPIVIDDHVGPRYVGHGGSTRVARTAGEIPLIFFAHDHVGECVERGQRTGLHRMPLLVAIRASCLRTGGASMSRLPAIGALDVFVRGARGRGRSGGVGVRGEGFE